ncbi:MAG TPA: undecaprenyldiphospho-muramoylpentapeptide beta-N-acetylglucosaminyltransferase, partial [Usitatibacter sp.]|nr:undecaprenyldiphospho-muramoylpentapeptide beta-N-acetylglucosaminyltransferase [Usitatibacter sp.]
ARIVIAGGGTGGHVFPAVAVAEALQALADIDVVFCGTDRGVETRVVPARGWRLELLDVRPLKGQSPRRAMMSAARAAGATLRALGLLRRLRPRVVLSVGGYASGPVALAAVMRRIPIAALEPNQVAGLATRLAAPFVQLAYIAWEETGSSFAALTRRLYGVPLRRGFAPRPYVPRRVGGGARVLVIGGSQGAAALNERMPEAMARVQRHLPGVEVTHQAGRDREATVRVAYAREAVHAAVVPFLDDMAEAIAGADLVVARAGAGTIAKITAIGRAALLVPFPYAADDHQARNAEALSRAGAAVCLRQEAADVPRLAVEIERLLSDGSKRVALADAARARGKPNAARDVAADLLSLANVEAR